MKKIAMIAVLFAVSLAVVGCGSPASTGKTGGGTGGTPSSEKK